MKRTSRFLVQGIAVAGLAVLLAACSQPAGGGRPETLTVIDGRVDSEYAGEEIFFDITDVEAGAFDPDAVLQRVATAVQDDGSFELDLPATVPGAALEDVFGDLTAICGDSVASLSGFPVAELQIIDEDSGIDDWFMPETAVATEDVQPVAVFMYAAESYRLKNTCSAEDVDGTQLQLDLNLNLAAGWNYLSGTLTYTENPATGVGTESVSLRSDSYAAGTRWQAAIW